MAAAAPALLPDCQVQVLPAGNGFPTWLATRSSTGVVTLTQNGTMFTGEMLDLAEGPEMTDMFGDTLERNFPANGTWYPVSNGAGTALVHVLGCSIN